MFFSEIQETLLRSKKNYLIAAFVGRSHTDYFHEDKTIFVCCFYHLLNGMQFDIRECLHGFFKCVMMLACIRPKMFLMLQKNYKEPFKILYEIYLLNMRIDFVRFSNSATALTKGTEDWLVLISIWLSVLQFHKPLLNLLKRILDLKSLGDILEKFMQSAVWQPGVLKLVGVSLMLTIRGRLWFSFLIFSDKVIDIEKGERFCQIVIQKIASHLVLMEVENFDEDKTVRGERLFRSINKNVCQQNFRQ